MSWILGFVGEKVTAGRRDKLAATHQSELFRSVSETYYVAVGGLVKTCQFGALPGQAEGHWCVVGTGIHPEAGGCRLLSAADWRRRMSAQRPGAASLGGGFVGLRWWPRTAEAFTDVLGLRTLYWTRLRDGYAFSTRLDWLTALRGGCRISPEAFGSHWLAQHQLSFKCLAENIDRLPPGGRVTFTGGSVQSERALWEPTESGVGAFPDLLSNYMTPQTEQGVSLGLSGGMNARLLLAVRPSDGGFSVHSFGPPESRDVAVAARIARCVNVPMSHFHLPLPDADALIALVRGHAVRSNALRPASASPFRRYYSLLNAQGKIAVVGACGEIPRRRYMPQLVARGRKAVESKRAPEAFEFMRVRRADVLSREYEREMGFAARRDLQELLDTVPAASKIGVENVVDRIGVRTLLPNFFGFEQARLDDEVRSILPFAQPPVLCAALLLSVPARRKMSRRLIARHEPVLRRFPVVKDDAAYPYRLPNAAASALVHLRRRLTRRPSDSRKMMETLRTYVLDRLHADEVRSSSLYDPSKLRSLAEDFYRDGSRAEEVDWWLALDFWREAIECGQTA